MATTGCCGVKKQKLHHNCRVVNGHLSTSTNCLNGLHQHSSKNLSKEDGIRSCSTSVLTNGDSCSAMDEEDCDDQIDYSSSSNNSRDEYDSGPSAGTRSHFSHQNGILRNGDRFVKLPRVVSKDMVTFCFEVLEAYLHSKDPPKTPKFPNETYPLFVTWKMGKERKLRGCIGTFNCTSLHQGLREYAVTSACKDSRFEPINPEEVNRLHCSVSLLMDFEIADHYLDWEIGVHGIRIEFSSDRGSKKAATYLPEVAVEQGWNHIQTVDSLLRKGGYKGTITPDIRASVCVIRFQSEKLTISYAEYLAHRQDRNEEKFQYSNGFTHNGYHHNSSSGRSSKHGSRFFPSLGGSSSSGSSNHHHRYPTRGSERPGASVHNHPPSGTARYLPLPNHPYMPPQL